MKRAEWQAERWTKDPLPCWWIWWAGICPLPLWEDWCWGRGSHRVGRKSGGKRGCGEGPWAVGCSSCLLFEPILQILAWVNIWRGCLYQEAFPDLPISLLQRSYHSLSGFPKHTFFSEVVLKLVFDIQRFHQQIFNEHPLCPSIPRWLAQWIKNLPALQETQEIQIRSLGQEDSPQRRKMATRSSILAWKIPWTEEPDRLQSLGSQRLGHDWKDWSCMHEPRGMLHRLKELVGFRQYLEWTRWYFLREAFFPSKLEIT